MNDNAKILKKAQATAEREIRKMVVVMGNDALNHFESSFRNQGFTDEGLERWKPRKRADRTRNKNVRAILTKTGALRRSLKKNYVGQYAIRISSNVLYANVHNEGLKSGRGRGFIMPKRQFVGYSGKLNRSLINKFNFKIHSIFY